jgi:hypothetical protein
MTAAKAAASRQKNGGGMAAKNEAAAKNNGKTSMAIMDVGAWRRRIRWLCRQRLGVSSAPTAWRARHVVGIALGISGMARRGSDIRWRVDVLFERQSPLLYGFVHDSMTVLAAPLNG